MKITTVQFETGSDYMISKLFVDGIYECFIMEDPLRDVKIHGITAIPRDTYEIIVTMSNRFKVMLPLLLNVSNYKGVRIHKLNVATETEGCLGPGLRLGQLNGKRAVLDSKTAFDRLFLKINKALARGEKVTIELT
jgi:hypothetical protein